jgi:hypothetical protein
MIGMGKSLVKYCLMTNVLSSTLQQIKAGMVWHYKDYQDSSSHDETQSSYAHKVGV